MKKTVNINLGNQVFQIDEDAYQLLDNYLNDLKHYFRKEKESGEIIQDIEYRFAELFGEKTRLGHRVITIEIVEETIARVGKPEELADDEAEDLESDKGSTKNDAPTTEKLKKKFYRDIDDRVFKGVLSGFAAYQGWDVVWLRLGFAAVVVTFTFAWFPVVMVVSTAYVIAMIIVPPARTAAQKLEMRGKRITVENIGKTVTGNFDRGDETVETQNSGVRGFFEGSLRVLGVLLKAALIVLGVILFLPLLFVVVILVFVLIVVVFALIGAAISGALGWPFGMFEGTEFFVLHGDSVMNTILFASGHGQGFFALALLTAGITIIMPIVALVYSVIGSIKKTKPLTKAVKLTSLAIWLLSLAFTIYAIVEFYPAAMQLL